MTMMCLCGRCFGTEKDVHICDGRSKKNTWQSGHGRRQAGDTFYRLWSGDNKQRRTVREGELRTSSKRINRKVRFIQTKLERFFCPLWRWYDTGDTVTYKVAEVRRALQRAQKDADAWEVLDMWERWCVTPYVSLNPVPPLVGLWWLMGLGLEGKEAAAVEISVQAQRMSHLGSRLCPKPGSTLCLQPYSAPRQSEKQE